MLVHSIPVMWVVLLQNLLTGCLVKLSVHHLDPLFFYGVVWVI